MKPRERVLRAFRRLEGLPDRVPIQFDLCTQLLEHFAQGYYLTHPQPVPPENTIVSFFRPFYAMTIMLQFCHPDGAGLRHGETLQYHPSLAVQQFGFQVDLCSMTSESGRYGNS